SAPALWPQMANVQNIPEPGRCEEAPAVRFHSQRRKLKLQVGNGLFGIRFDESAAVGRGEDKRFFATEISLQEGLCVGARNGSEGGFTRVQAADHDVWVILKILANTRQVFDDRYAMFFQLLPVANTRQFEQLRRIDYPGAENDFFAREQCLRRATSRPGALIFHAGGPIALKQNSGNVHAGHYRQVRAFQCFVKEGVCSVTPVAVRGLGNLEETTTLLAGAIKVRVKRIASLMASFDEGMADRKPECGIHHVHSALITVIGI